MHSGPHRCANHRNNRIAFGALVVLIGVIVLIKKLGVVVFPFPMWPLVLIAVGLFLGVKSNFRSFGSWVLIALGILFIIPKFYVFGILSVHLVAPLILILLGTYMIVTPGRRAWRRQHAFMGTVSDDTLNMDVTFGEKTTVVTSKAFKGGAVSNTFGSTKINLLQADSNEKMLLHMSVSFGSVEIVVPSHWEVEFHIENSFSSVEDKRYLRTSPGEERKTLILKGSCSFGSITVKSA